MAKKFLTDINIAGGVYDSSGDIGSSGQVLSSTGSGINWIDANSAASVVYQDGFTGDGSTTAFTLANSIDNENKTQVYIDGVYQHKDNYSLSGTTLTFSTAPPNSSDIEVISFSTVSSADDILYDTDFGSAGLMTTNGSGVYSITTNNSSNWNTAYTYSQVGHLPLAGGTLTGAVQFNDNVHLNIGSSADLKIYHDGTNSHIKNYTGHLYIENFADDKDIKFLSDNGSGGTQVYFELQGISGGTNPFTVFPDNSFLVFGNGHDLQIYHDGNDSIIADTGAGNLYIRGAGQVRLQGSDQSNMLIGNQGGSVGIYHNNSAKIETASYGAQIINLSNTTAVSETADKIKIGTFGSGRPAIFFDTSNTTYTNRTWFIENIGHAGKLRFGRNGKDIMEIFNDGDIYMSDNLGIGTTSPGAKLDVDGTIRLSTSGRVEGRSYPYTTNIGSTANATTTNITAGSSDKSEISLLGGDVGDRIEFKTNSTERMRLDASGNLGIGTTSPSDYNASARNLVVYSTGNTGITIASNNTSSDGTIRFADGTGGTAGYRGSIQYSHGGDFMNFNTAASERMRIDSSGRVGINETAPATLLSLAGLKNEPIITLKSTTNDSNWTAGDKIGGINFYSEDGSGSGAGIKGSISYIVTSGTGGAGAMTFNVAGSANNDVERMRIDANGNIDITGNGILKAMSHLELLDNGGSDGTATSPRLYSPASGTLAFSGNGSERMRINSSGNVGIGTTSPSAKLMINTLSDEGIRIYRSDVNANFGAIEFRNSNDTATNSRIGFNSNEMRLEATNQFRFVTNSSDRMFINSSGNVGIGDITPDAKLDVELAATNTYDKTALNTPNIIVSNENSSNVNSQASIVSLRSTGWAGSTTGVVNLVAFQAGNASSAHFAIQTRNGGTYGERMRISSDGRVGFGVEPFVHGLGTSVNIDLLGNGGIWGYANATYVNSNAYYDGGWKYKSNGIAAALQVGGSANTLTFRQAASGTAGSAITYTEAFRVHSNGNVGIGTSSPSQKLEVRDGDITTRDASNTNYAQLSRYTGLILKGNGAGSRGIKTPNTDALTLGTNNTERMRITSGGNVELKPTNPVGMAGGNTNYLGFRITQTNSQSALLGTIYTQGVANWGGNLIFSTKPSNGTPNDAVSERMRIDASGNVGIGNTNPSNKLRIDATAGQATTLSNSITNAAVYINSDTANGSNNLRIGESGSGSYFLQVSNSAGTTPYAINLNPFGANVGIGTTSPDFALDIEASGSGVQLQIGRTSSNVGSTWMGSDSNGFHLGVGTYGSGNSVSDPNGFTIDTSGKLTIGERIVVNSSDSANNGLILYGGINDAGIIYSFRDANSSGSVFRWYTGGTKVGSVSTTTSSTSFNTSSDYRLKENVVEMTGALDRVSQLKPSRFNFIIDPNKTVDGFLAHEVQNIVPEAITGEKDAIDEDGNPEYQAIDQSKLVPLLVGAIQELKAEIETLKTQING